jgi:ATPase family associated with various cellular activities (AAA)
LGLSSQRDATVPPAASRLEWVSSRLRAAVATRIALVGEEEATSLRAGISPELAWDALDEADLGAYEGRLARAAALLALDQTSLDVLWLCAAPELDNRIGLVFGFLLDDPAARQPTPRLVASLLDVDGVASARFLSLLSADAPLRTQGCLQLIDTDDGTPLADRAVRLAPDLAGFLLEAQLDKAEFDPRLRRHEVPRYPVGRAAALTRIRAALEAPGAVPVVLAGPDSAELLAFALGRGLLLVDARSAGDCELLSRARLSAALEERVIAFDHNHLLAEEEVSALISAVGSGAVRGLVCTAGAEGSWPLGSMEAITISTPLPTPAERRAAWSALAEVETTDEVAAKFRLSTEQIARAARIARAEAEVAGRRAPNATDLDAGARQASRSAIGDRARRLEPNCAWDELVLPDAQLEQLRSIVAHLRHRDQVLIEWGYERAASGRLGISVLFAGDSGTGKTMAARVLAADLGLELFAINLATVVSKFVGETEHNLERVFAAAEGSNAILLFDEADALFGRRSEVSESSDRYANIEVAYLLQRMEAHTGIVILTTNLKQNLDAAFLRRFDFAVDFRFPDEDDRRRLWRTVIPAQAPVAADIDVDFLAERFKLSGGSIRNCSLTAAFEAASVGQPIRMAHIVRAIASEYRKLGRLTLESDFDSYFGMLRNLDAAPEPEAVVEPAPELAPPGVAAPRSGRVRLGARIEEL